MLLCCQIEIDEGKYAGLFIVTNVKKIFMRRTRFELNRGGTETAWVYLQRGKSKKGIKFRPLRQVVANSYGDV